MNEYFALDPRAPQSARDVADLYRIFSPDSGRFLLTMPESWSEEFVRSMRLVSDLCGLRAEEFLKITMTLPHESKSRKNLKWEEIAVELIETTKAILGDREVKPHIRAFDAALSETSLWVDASEGHIARNAVSYARVAEPIFRASPKVSLVDPYFRLRYKPPGYHFFKRSIRHIQTLEQFIGLAAKYRKVKVLCLFINEEYALEGDPQGVHFQAELDAIKDSIPGADSLIVEFRRLSRELSFDSHPRYLLGHKAGLRFDWGFESRPDDPRTQHLAWIGRRALGPLLDRFL
jgi:hypothetical protein